MSGAKKISNVQLMPAITGISRKLALRRETATTKEYSHVGGKSVTVPGNTYMGVMSYQRKIQGVGIVTKNILFIRKPFKLGLATSSQIAVRELFVRSAEWVNAAQKDLTAITTNQQRFKAACQDFNKRIAGVSAYGYSTMSGWMKAVMYAHLEDGHELPQTHILPDFDA